MKPFLHVCHPQVAFLAASTALVALGLPGASAAQEKPQNQPLALSVGGSISTHYSFVSQDDGATMAMGERRSHALFRKGDIKFGGQTRLSSGLLIGARVNIEAADLLDQIDEAWIFFDSAYGRIEIGETDNPAWKMYYGSPTAIPGFATSDHDFIDWNTNNTSAGITAPAARLDLGNDSARINYFTPRFSGFQLGVGYSPENCKEGDRDGCNTAAGARGRNGSPGIALGGPVAAGGAAAADDIVQDVWEIGLNYVRSFNEIDFAAYGAYNRGRNVTASNDALGTGLRGADPHQWGVGASVGYAGFTVGGAYSRKTDVADLDNTHWNAGVNYKTGDWAFGLEYARAVQERAVAGVRAQDDKGRFWYLGVTYDLGPGIVLFGGATLFDLDAGNPVAGGVGRQDNNGVVARMGTTLAF